jgi:hypothetical protein
MKCAIGRLARARRQVFRAEIDEAIRRITDVVGRITEAGKPCAVPAGFVAQTV